MNIIKQRRELKKKRRTNFNYLQAARDIMTQHGCVLRFKDWIQGLDRLFPKRNQWTRIYDQRDLEYIGFILTWREMDYAKIHYSSLYTTPN